MSNTHADYKFGFTRTKAFEIATSLCPPGGRVLEFSCGDGKLCAALQKVGYDVVGTNYSVYDAPDDTVKIVNGVDITKETPFAGESFDCIILSETI